MLSASAALAMAQALAASGIEQIEQTAKSADPATPLGTDTATHEPIDPGDRVVSGNPPASENGTPGTKGPAAENLTESENRSVTPLGESDVAAGVEMPLVAPLATQATEQAWLALTVVGDQQTSEGATLAIQDLGKFTDPQLLSDTYYYTIDWGDGRPGDSGFATIDDFGGDGIPRTGSFDGAHIYADNGNYTVTVTIAAYYEGEGFGYAESAQFSVNVVNVAPTLTVVPNQVTTEGALLSITDLGKFSDPGFDNPLNVGGEINERFTYAINWGDGSPVQSGSATIDVAGGPGTPTQGSFDGSHIYADNGVYTVTVTLTDDDGGIAVQTFEVRVNNVAPTLSVAPNQVTTEGTLLSIANLGVITDPGFDNPLNVGGEVSEKFTYAINWGDGTPVQSGPVTIDAPGGPGTPTSGSFDGSHIYADNGVYTVTVTVIDDDGGIAVQTFQVVVHNVAPVLTVAPDQIVNEGALLTITNIGQFTDPGFDNPLNVGGEVSEKFTYSIDWGDGTPIQSGPATIDIPGGPGTPTSGSFDGSHIYADNGVYTVTVTVIDDDGGATAQTFKVTVNNVAPTLVVPGDQVADEGQLLSLPNIGQFTDPGFDNPLNVGGETTERFTYSIDWGDGTPIQSGPATIDIPGGPGLATSGSFDGAHTYLAPGTYTVTVSVFDDDGGVARAQFRVTVRETALIVVAGPNHVIDEGSLLSVTDIGKFIDPRGGGGPYTFSIDWGDGRPADGGIATIDSGGDGTAQGSFDGSHVYADNGIYNVTLKVTAADGRTSLATLQVQVNNIAPTLIVGGDITIPLGDFLNINDIGIFDDPAFDNLLNVGGETTERFTFSVNWGDGTPNSAGPATIDVPGAVGLRTAGSFDASHLYAAPGNYTVTVTVADDDGGVAVGTFNITVFILRPTVTGLPPGGGGGGTVVPPPQIAYGDLRLAHYDKIIRHEEPGLRAASVAGAEPRLVLRVVTPDGEEDRTGEQPLDDEVLDNLRALFRRLPDGHYRIYQIQPDGIERQVVDVVVQQGRATELEETVVPAAATKTSEQPATAPTSSEPPATVPATNETSRRAAPLPVDGSPAEQQLSAAGLGLALPLRRVRNRLRMKPAEPLPLTKAHRILRRR